MKIRKETLWRIPLYYLLSSWISFHLLVRLYSFCIIKTVDTDGVTNVSVNPVASTLVEIVVLLGVLLIGGFWLCRTMTRREVAVSAGILSVVYFLWVLSEILFPGWDTSTLGVMVMNLNAVITGLLYRLTGQFELSALIGCFTPMLFVLFARKSISGKTDTP